MPLGPKELQGTGEVELKYVRNMQSAPMVYILLWHGEG